MARDRPRLMVLPGGVQAASEQQETRLRTQKFSRALDAFVAHYIRTVDTDVTLRDAITSLLALAGGLAVVAGAGVEQFRDAAGFMFEQEEEARTGKPEPPATG